MCVICGKDCGPLKGEAKSWRCAGVKSRETAKLNRSLVAWGEARARYDNPGKRKARAVVMRILERLPTGARYLDLNGGGQSAEEAARLRPDIGIVSAETDRTLWPAMATHAARIGYEALFGSFIAALGKFDLIYLDLTHNSSDNTAIRLVRAASSMLAPGGWLVVTITPHHEKDSAVSLNRPVTVVSLLAAESGMRAVGAMRYPSSDGQRVTLTVLHRFVANLGHRPWTFMLDIWRLDEDMKRRGFWMSGQKDRGGYGFLFGSANQRWRADPKNAARIRERDRANAKRSYEKRRTRMALDPAYAAEQRAKARVYRKTERGRASATASHRRWREANREKWNAYRRDLYARKAMAAVSGTAAEAISNEVAA